MREHGPLMLHLFDNGSGSLPSGDTGFFDGNTQDPWAVQKHVSAMPVSASRESQDVLRRTEGDGVVVELDPFVLSK